MALWPATLPQNFEQEGYSELSPDMTVRTKMDTGPAKVRRRFTAAPYPMSGTMRMTKDQTVDLDTFYQTTTHGGADVFTFIHPRKGTTLSCRFTAPPEYSSFEHDFNVALKFEVLP